MRVRDDDAVVQLHVGCWVEADGTVLMHGTPDVVVTHAWDRRLGQRPDRVYDDTFLKGRSPARRRPDVWPSALPGPMASPLLLS